MSSSCPTWLNPQATADAVNSMWQTIGFRSWHGLVIVLAAITGWAIHRWQSRKD